ncbi:MAG: lysyl oxidase family protein [Planctomycetota bacterium]
MVRYEGNTNNGSRTDRVYFDCAGAYQGVSVGWVDQYHQATDGQELDLTGLPAGYYYLVSTANYGGVFLEKDLANNFAWVFFELSRDSKGNAKIEPIADSFEIEGAGLPDTYSPNR